MHTLLNIATLFAVGAVAAVLVTLAVVVFLRRLDRWVFPQISFSRELHQANGAVGIFLGLIAGAFILGLFLLAGRAVAAPTTQYDGAFRQAWRYEFGYTYRDWEWGKAQGMAESALDPAVCSNAGACGLMQFMPGTARAMGLVDRFEAEASIRAGIAYDRRLWGEWTAPRPRLDRLAFTFASYNAGLGPVLRFQREARAAGVPDANLWRHVAPHAWEEPRAYVARIGRWCERFNGGVPCA